MSAAFTHIGGLAFTGHIHAAKLYGHGDYNGKRHALNGPQTPYEGAKYKAICGKAITAQDDGNSLSVWAGTDAAKVTCRACRKKLPTKQEQS